jgi:hypothetical protein
MSAADTGLVALIASKAATPNKSFFINLSFLVQLGSNPRAFNLNIGLLVTGFEITCIKMATRKDNPSADDQSGRQTRSIPLLRR